MRLGAWALALFLGCGGQTAWQPPSVGGSATPLIRTEPELPEQVEPASAPRPPARSASPKRGARLRLALGSSTLRLNPGRWVVGVEVGAESFVTMGLQGPRHALRRFEIVGSRRQARLRTGTIDDDGLLPAFVSFETRDAEQELLVVVDVDAPVTLLRVQAAGERKPPSDVLVPLGEAGRLIGLPFPTARRDGYVLQAAHRYQFLRGDVVAALRGAFRQTRMRFKRNPLGVGDGSQWNGVRPATDQGKPRHISHHEGRDIDIGLPTRSAKVSLLQRRCEGVLVERGVLRCGPGTVAELDAIRLAYFLGLLIDGPTSGGRHIADRKRRPGPVVEVETIFTDQAYIDEIRKALVVLRRKRWIHEEAFGALGEEGLLRPSPWHVDHVHIRFHAKAGGVPQPLRFEAMAPRD